MIRSIVDRSLEDVGETRAPQLTGGLIGTAAPQRHIGPFRQGIVEISPVRVPMFDEIRAADQMGLATACGVRWPNRGTAI